MSLLPTVFISHGSPLHALQSGAVGLAWRDLAARLPRPQAILVASAHWETELPLLSGAAAPVTLHDFHGFPAPLYRLRYPAPGAPVLAARACRLLAAAQIPAALDDTRGFDHGVWSPLLHLYPQADIPVVVLSVQPGLGPRHHLRLGEALAPLAAEGVLVLGSGHLTHNLYEWLHGANHRGDAPYVRTFQSWVQARLAAGDRAALCDYRAQAPQAARAHPTEEHFLPLFVALGAAGPNARPDRVYDRIEDGVLAMDIYTFSPGAA